MTRGGGVTGPYLVRSSFEDAGALVDGFRPQLDVVVLQFLGGSVQRFGNQASLRNLTLKNTTRRTLKLWPSPATRFPSDLCLATPTKPHQRRS